MSIEKVEEKVEKDPIPSGDTFNGTCVNRIGSVQLYYGTGMQALFGNAAGFGYILHLLDGTGTKDPHWAFYLVLCLMCQGAIYVNLYAIYRIRSTKMHIALWTNRLYLLEKTNGVKGGINMFSSLDYRALEQEKTTMANSFLTHFLKICIISWGVVALTAAYLFYEKQEIIKWMMFHLYSG
jgi:hypothetical protein